MHLRKGKCMKHAQVCMRYLVTLKYNCKCTYSAPGYDEKEKNRDKDKGQRKNKRKQNKDNDK